MVCEDRTYYPQQGSLKREEGASNSARTTGVNKPRLLQATGSVVILGMGKVI